MNQKITIDDKLKSLIEQEKRVIRYIRKKPGLLRKKLQEMYDFYSNQPGYDLGKFEDFYRQFQERKNNYR